MSELHKAEAPVHRTKPTKAHPPSPCRNPGRWPCHNVQMAAIASAPVATLMNALDHGKASTSAHQAADQVRSKPQLDAISGGRQVGRGR